MNNHLSIKNLNIKKRSKKRRFERNRALKIFSVIIVVLPSTINNRKHNGENCSTSIELFLFRKYTSADIFYKKLISHSRVIKTSLWTTTSSSLFLKVGSTYFGYRMGAGRIKYREEHDFRTDMFVLCSLDRDFKIQIINLKCKLN